MHRAQKFVVLALFVSIIERVSGHLSEYWISMNLFRDYELSTLNQQMPIEDGIVHFRETCNSLTIWECEHSGSEQAVFI